MTNTALKIQKIRDVKTPTRAFSTDAGIDFYIPTTLTVADFDNSLKLTTAPPLFPPVFNITPTGLIISITLNPHTAVLIPAGVKVIVPENHALIFFNKSGVATKRHLDVGACVVDAGYRAEVHIHLINTSDMHITLYPGDKIIQGVVLPINTCGVEVVDDIDALGTTDRGSGGFGSTNTL